MHACMLYTSWLSKHASSLGLPAVLLFEDGLCECDGSVCRARARWVCMPRVRAPMNLKMCVHAYFRLLPLLSRPPVLEYRRVAVR